MTSKHRSLSAGTRVGLLLVAGLAGSLLMAGCGLGNSPVSSSDVTSAASFGGKINGGPNPIQHAVVKLYTTGDAYGTGVFAQEANSVSGGGDTGPDGSFTFAGGYACPAGHFVYIVSSGGFTGGNEANLKAVLVVAVGRCDDLFTAGKYTGGFIYLNEASTVAAAYALGGFSTVTGSTVGIGAPPANNASVGCVAGTAGCASTASAGLRHAFQNAANLVSPFSPTGNSTLSGGGRVPLQLINAIANVAVACVNSDGSAQACSTLYSATNTNTSNGVLYQALVNLAANPSLNGSSVTPTQLFLAASPQTSFYLPTLTGAPPDYSIAISYPKLTGAGATAGLTSPKSGTLDINDNYLVGNYDAPSNPTSANAVSFNTSGLVSITTPSTVNLDSDGASADALGNLYLVGYSPSLPAASITDYTVATSTGVISTSQVYYVGSDHLISSAADRKNNLWFGSQLNPTIAELNAFPKVVAFSKSLLAPVTAVGVDPNQNIWVTTASTTSTNAVGVVENIGTVPTPSYSANNYLNTPIPSFNLSGVSFVPTGNSAAPFVTYVANITSPGFTRNDLTFSGAQIATDVPAAQNPTTSNPVNNMTDSSAVIWAAAGSNIVRFDPAGRTDVLKPCAFVPSNSNTSCMPSSYLGIKSVSIDATGSVWFSDTTQGTVGQIIGSAPPTWPLLSLGLQTKPQ